jgi:hypothetical protein
MPLTHYSKFSMITLQIWVFKSGVLKKLFNLSKHFGKFPFMSWMNYSSLSRLYINSWTKYSLFIQMDETWENGQFKKKYQHTSYTTKSTRGTVIILTKWYLPPTAFLNINLSLLEMSERNISLRVYLQIRNDVLP